MLSSVMRSTIVIAVAGMQKERWQRSVSEDQTTFPKPEEARASVEGHHPNK